MRDTFDALLSGLRTADSFWGLKRFWTDNWLTIAALPHREFVALDTERVARQQVLADQYERRAA